MNQHLQSVQNKVAATAQGGRPPRYQEVYSKQAYKICLLGASDRELAFFFEVAERTINRWKRQHPAFRTALFRGKAIADAEVAYRLYQRAIGYEHADIHITAYQGVVITTPFTRRYPPDTQAAIFWLKNRRPATWSDQQRVRIDTPDTISVRRDESNGDIVIDFTPEQIDRFERRMLASPHAHVN